MHNVLLFLIPGLVVLVFFGLLHSTKLHTFLQVRKWYWVALGLIILIQLLSITLITQEVGDVKQFGKAGYFLRFRSDFYTVDQDHSQYPFFPFLIFFHAFAHKLSVELAVFPFAVYLKGLLLVALHLIGVWINRKSGPVAQLKFLSSPITYATVIYHGQIDVILLMFLIGALELLSRRTAQWWSLVLASLLFAASVATKTWSVIFTPLLIKFFGVKKTLTIGVATVLFLVLNIWFYTQSVSGAKLEVIITAVTKSGGPVGIWGLSLLLSPWQEWLRTHNLIIFAGLLLVGLGLIWRQRIQLWSSCLLLILWFYVITPNWGVQYLFWVMPFLMVTRPTRFSLVFVWLGGLYCWLNYLNVAAESALMPLWLVKGFGLVVWFFILVWVYRLLHLPSRVALR